jgi:hypothetical protein
VSDDWEHALAALEQWTERMFRHLAEGELERLAPAPAPPPLRVGDLGGDQHERARRAQDALRRLEVELAERRDATGRELARHRRRPLGAGSARPIYVDGYG